MASNMENPAARPGLPEDVHGYSNNPEHKRLDALRQRYLAEVFDLAPDTAVTVAELWLGEAGR